MLTIKFEDHGQDFLEWDIDQNGIVTDCRPYQKRVWVGHQVHSPETLQPGSLVSYTSHRPSIGRGQIKYKVLAIINQKI